MKNIDKIVNALVVLNTDKREESISSIIKFTLFSLGQPANASELIEFVELEYEIKFNKDEIEEIIDGLIQEGSLQIYEGKLRISSIVKEEIQLKQLESRRLYENGFTQFKQSFNGICKKEVDEKELKKLYALFRDYLNECYYVCFAEAASALKLISSDIPADADPLRFDLKAFPEHAASRHLLKRYK